MPLNSISLTNLLSFTNAKLDLRPLNVLIGPNAAGKSNLISAIGLLKAAPDDLSEAIRRGGGVREWVSKRSDERLLATIDCQIEFGSVGSPLSYSLAFRENDYSAFQVFSEVLSSPEGGLIFDRTPGRASIRNNPKGAPGETRVSEYESLLAAYRNPMDPTPITALGKVLGDIRIYREFDTGPASAARNGASVDSERGGLQECGDNLALVLQDLDFRGKQGVLSKYLQRFWDGAQGVKTKLEGRFVHVHVKERGINDPIPAARLSDGTLKFLCLMAVLLHPEPPPLICIEAPELGLHPDALSIVADALREASQKSQVIVTTHSDALVSDLSDQAGSVVVCERDAAGGTQFKRLHDMDGWLERYRLGELWRMGEIGGNRW